MYEADLGRVMSGAEKAPTVAEDADAATTATYERKLQKFQEKNGKLYTRLLLATSDCPEGYSSPASQVVQSFGPVGDEEFGDGRSAFVALEQKYRVDGTFRMQQLHDELAAVAVTAADKYDPARAIQQLRRIFHELGKLGDTVVKQRQAHAILKALPDKQYGSFKTVLLVESPTVGSGALGFDDIARRATLYHAMQIRGKVLDQDDGSGSHGRALNTVTHGGARGFRKHGGRGGRGGRRGNGGRTTNGSTNGSSNGNYSSGGGSAGNAGGGSAGNAQGARGNYRGNNASGGRGKGQDTGRNRKGRCRYCHNSTEHGWHNCPLRLRHEAEEATEQADTHHTQDSTTQAWFTRVETEGDVLEDYAISFGKDVQVQDAPAAAQPEERAAGDTLVQDAPVPTLQDARVVYDPQVLDTPAAAVVYDPAANGYSQTEEAPEDTELVAFSSVFQVDKEKPQVVDDSACYIDSAASSHMVDEQSRLSHHVLNPVDCAVRIIGSCGTSDATKKGTLKFGVRNDQDQVVRVALEVLLVRGLGANILSVGALAEKGVMCDLMSTPPALRMGNQVFPISTAVPRMYVLNVIIDDVNLGAVEVNRTKVDAHLWHRRMGHCNSRALQQLADKDTTGIRFNRNIEPGDCGVCAVGDSKKGSHPPSNRPLSETRLEILNADTWGKHPIATYGGCQSAVMFTDDATRMRFGYLLKTKDETAEALQTLVRDEADPLGQSIGTVHCDGGAEYLGKFLALCKSLGIKLTNSPPYVPQGNPIAERGFGTIIGTARKLLLGAPHLPQQLWGEAFMTAIYLKNRTPTEVLGGKAPLEVWEGKPLGKMLHIHEWGSLAFKHEEVRARSNKLAARAKKMYLVGYNSKGRSYRLWDPSEPLKITNSVEVSFREKRMRDVIKPKLGQDPLPAPNSTFYRPGLVDSIEEEEENNEESSDESEPEAPAPRRSSRNSVAPQRLNLFTKEQAYERTEHAMVTGSDFGNLGRGSPGEVGYMPADPATYDEAMSGPDAARWRASMNDEEQSLYDHDVFDWVLPPEDAQLLPTRFHYRWKYNQEHVPVRPKSRVVVQGFHEADTGADKAAPVASMESVHLVVSHAAGFGQALRQADMKTAFLNSRMSKKDKPIYVIPPKGFTCSQEQTKLVWRLKAWLYGLRLSPKSWNGTFHLFLLEIGFVPSTADPCLYTLNGGEVILLVYVDDILLTGAKEELVTTIIEQMKERFETVDLGEAKFILGMAIQRNLEAGTILLTQEAYTKAVLAKFGMADVRATATPAEKEPVTTKEENALSPEQTTMFRSATGSVLYISRGSRPDISHSVLVLTKSMAKPGPKALAKLKRLMRYLKGTTSLGITYRKDAQGGDKLTAYVDSDFAGDLDDRKSTTGVVLTLAGGPVDTTSVKQTVTATSSAEAEYVAMSKACKMILHWRHLLKTINREQTEATVLFEDSTAAISTSESNKVTQKTKHIDVKYHHVRSLIVNKVVEVKKIDTNLQKADMLTKNLGTVKFLNNRRQLLGM
ncbi:unnamed protein product [Ectocarpus sp. CCAP 1310/34]|nr:unnamed protein product [Ectocarpus sp. CCAP 1310/34]